MDQTFVDYIKREVEDVLPAGRVGLYEFVWFGRGYGSDIADETLREHANVALVQLLESGRVRLTWQLWGDPDYSKDAEGSQPRSADFDDPTDKPYLAVVSSTPGETH